MALTTYKVATMATTVTVVGSGNGTAIAYICLYCMSTMYYVLV
jgi:hypothetical protein